MKRIIIALAALALAPFAMYAGQAAHGETNPVSSALRAAVARASKNLVAAAAEMPADKYSYKPTPQQMTFGKLVEHMAGGNNILCSKVSGKAAPAAEKLSETDPKEKLVGALKSSFAYCTQALANADDSKLGEPLTVFGGRTVSRAAAIIMLTNDFADHYGMAAMYLRLNGLLPPTAQHEKK